MCRVIVSLAVLLSGVPSMLAQAGPAQEEEAISWDQAKDHVGKTVVIEGRVINTRRVPNAIHLDFHPDFASHFRIIIPASATPKFTSDPMVRFKARNVRVTGKVEEERGIPFIRVTDPKNLRAVPVRR